MARRYDDLTPDEKLQLVEMSLQEAAALLGDRVIHGSSPNAQAAIARARNELPRLTEGKRQRDIEGAVAKIKGVFGKYDDPYYEKLKSDYLGYHEPQVASQYEQARRQLTYQLARGSGEASSAGVKAIGGLQSQLQRARAGVAEGAMGHIERTKQNVNRLKGSLIQQAYGGEGLGELGEQATAAAAGSQEPGYNPIGDIFAMGANMYANNRPRTRVTR